MARLVLGGFMPVLGGVRKRTVPGRLKRHSRTKRRSSSSSSSPSKKQGGSWLSWGRSTRRSTRRKGRKGCSKKRRR